jgi:hypothetical protein
MVKETLLNPTKNKVLATIGQFRDALDRDHRVNAAHAKVLARCLHVDDRDGLDYARVLTQVGQDVEDFANDVWCGLANTSPDKTRH